MPENDAMGCSSHLDRIRTADLFCGIGGIRLGMSQALGDRMDVVFSSDINKFSRQTYEANFGDEPVGDIRQVDAADIPDIDLLLAGFPCTTFSAAGIAKRHSLGMGTGFEDKTQGTLFFEVARILDGKRPRAFLLENVKNLLSHDRGRTWKTIEDVLTNDLGYHVWHKVIDAQGWIPQHRERTYIVGFADDVPFSFDGITPSGHGTVGEDVLLPPDEVPDRYVLSDRMWAWHQAHRAKHAAAGNGYGYSIVYPDDDHTRTLTAHYHKDGAEALVYMGEGRNPRKLMPRECARLMGFPDTFEIPVFDTQAYRQFGNSVAVPVVRAVGERMAKFL